VNQDPLILLLRHYCSPGSIHFVPSIATLFFPFASTLTEELFYTFYYTRKETSFALHPSSFFKIHHLTFISPLYNMTYFLDFYFILLYYSICCIRIKTN